MKSTFSEFKAICWPYWGSSERRLSALLLAVVVSLSLGNVYILVLLNKWYSLFYNALQDKDFSAFMYQLGRFGVLAAIYIVAAVYQIYLRQMLQIRWRNWLTQRYIGRWLDNDAYYHMQIGQTNKTDNPDQRISDDINGFVSQTLILGLGVLEAVVTLASFTLILWELSGTLTVAGIAIPGYMLWAAVLYAIVGSWLIHYIGSPLVSLNFQQQQFEANFRFSLIRVRENAEQIAMYRGGNAEKGGLRIAFSDVIDNWWGIMRRQKLLSFFSSGYSQIATIFPYLVAAPRYFAGDMQLGGLMQTASAFGQVQSALSWFITNYSSFAEWRATLSRLSGFETTLSNNNNRPSAVIATRRTGADAITVDRLSINLPDGRTLLKDVSLRLPAGDRVLIAGPSGSGKSTFLRSLCGVWPYCAGRIEYPQGARLLFSPQKSYIPIGTLRDAVRYPEIEKDHDDDAVVSALAAVGLDDFRHRLGEHNNWAMTLSPGEQQRLAFARTLLIQPEWVFLDEATSALDEEAEQRLYGLIADLPRTAIVSIAHRRTIAAFHHRTIMFTKSPTATLDQPLSRVLSAVPFEVAAPGE